MPFLITTTRPSPLGAAAKRSRDRAGIASPEGIDTVVSSRAVVTLEAREFWTALRALDVPADEDLMNRLADLTEQGGTVSLPDGTTIEAKPRSGRDLAADLLREHGIHLPIDATDEQIVTALNTAQETTE